MSNLTDNTKRRSICIYASSKNNLTKNNTFNFQYFINAINKMIKIEKVDFKYYL